MIGASFVGKGSLLTVRDDSGRLIRHTTMRFAFFHPVALSRLGLLGCLISSATLRADVRLPSLFSDHMVLQRGKPIPVWGWADNGEEVTVEFLGKKTKTVAKDGKWLVRLPSQKAGGPFELRIQGKNKLTLADVLVGEVWVCSGQSNMDWSMTRSENPGPDIAASANANLRLFTVPKLKATEPVGDVKSSWKTSSPESTAGFSAVAYYFGRDLQKSLGVPVGLIHTSWGGSPAEVWMSQEVLESNPTYKRDILDQFEKALNNYQTALAKHEKELETAKKENRKPVGNRPNLGWRPSELYNGMIHPLLPFAIQGAIWYQGESNAGRAHQYRSLFADMIKNWRSKWGQGDFAFLEVQLAPWDKNKKRSLTEIVASPTDSDWAELREAQWMATRTLPNVGMVVITDVGDKDDIHPAKKAPVGARLALAARKIAYREKLVHSGPLYKSHKIDGSEIKLRFDHVGSGLEARGGALSGFSIAGPDEKFYWAEARIEVNQIVVSSPKVPKPVAVRFGWADYPVVNLFNREGLPASPFRTDNFRMVTEPKGSR